MNLINHMEISLKNIHSLTEFKRNANVYVEQVRNSLSPLVLTVNGEAAVIVQDVAGFQAMIDRLQAVEAELQELKLAQLRDNLQVRIDQLDRGESKIHTKVTMHLLFEDIKQQGRAGLEIESIFKEPEN
jgi:prevent-host-death family protein